MITYTPIWDVFMRQRGRDGAGEDSCTRVRSPSFQIKQDPIRQVVPVGLAQAWARCWAHLAWFFIPKKCTIVASIYLHLFHPLPGIRGGGNAWIALIDLVDLQLIILS